MIEGKGLVPTCFGGVWQIAKMIHKSGMAPKHFRSPEAIAIAISYGIELGLPYMRSVWDIHVINGRPSVGSQLAKAIVIARGLVEDWRMEITETERGIEAYCYAKRSDNGMESEETFSISDAKRAGLYKQGGNWSKYPRRMVRNRARGFVLKDLFPDVLSGLAIEGADGDISPPSGDTEPSGQASDNEGEKPEKKTGMEALMEAMPAPSSGDGESDEGDQAPSDSLTALMGAGE